MVLLDVNPSRFENFPKSFYTAKNALGIEKLGKTYAVCPECNTLYNISEILTQDRTDWGDSSVIMWNFQTIQCAN